MKISACWIVKDEAKNLARSIESVRNAVDELVVLDTGSADGSDDLARSLGARVGSFVWEGDFSAARNAALELTTGELVVFPDADEWFDPPLEPKDGALLERIFSGAPALDAVQVTIHNLDDRGAVINSGTVDRILKRRPGLAFRGRVHERYLGEGGREIRKQYADFWALRHTGYAPSVLAGKAERNIQLLERTAQVADREEAFLSHCYLVREYQNLKRPDEALGHLRATLDSPTLLKRYCREMGEGFLALLQPMLDAAGENRQAVSSLEIDRKLVALIEKVYDRHPLSATIRLYFQMLFGQGEDSLLAELDGALAAARRMPPPAFSVYLAVEAKLLLWAAEAAELRGDSPHAVEYAAACLRMGADYPGALRILLRAWRGTPLQTVANRLAELYPAMGPAKLNFLTKNTRVEGCRELAVAYLERLVVQGWADGEDILLYLLLADRREEALELALRPDAPEHGLLLAAIRWNDRALAEKHRERLGADRRVAEAYFSGGALDQPTEEERRALTDCYSLVAFLAGIDAADRLGKLYGPDRLSADLRREYRMAAGLYGEILAEGDSAEQPEALVRARCLTVLGRYGEALAAVRPVLEADPGSEEGLRYLLVAAEKAGGDAAGEARRLYGRHQSYRERLRDWRGAMRSGYAADRFDKKQLRALRTLTMAQLEQAMEKDRRELATEELLALCEEAGILYGEQRMPAMALECHRFAAAHGRVGAMEGMALALNALGNHSLAAKLRSLRRF